MFSLQLPLNCVVHLTIHGFVESGPNLEAIRKRSFDPCRYGRVVIQVITTAVSTTTAMIHWMFTGSSDDPKLAVDAGVKREIALIPRILPVTVVSGLTLLRCTTTIEMVIESPWLKTRGLNTTLSARLSSANAIADLASAASCFNVFSVSTRNERSIIESRGLQLRRFGRGNRRIANQRTALHVNGQRLGLIEVAFRQITLSDIAYPDC